MLHREVTVLLALALAATAGCQSQPENPSPLEEGITIKDLPDYQPPEYDDDVQANAAPATSPVISEKLVARRYIFDRPAPKLTLALSMVDDEALPPSQRRLWRENGFGIGRLERSRLQLFLANAPQPRSIDEFRISNPARYRPISLIRQKGGSDRIRLVRPDRPTKTLRRSAGEYQLLMKLLPPVDPDSEPTHIDLLPHHYKDLPSVVPQSPEEDFLDGMSFDALRLDQPVDADRIWVIWVREPGGLPEDEADDEGQGGTDDTDKGEGEDAPQSSAAGQGGNEKTDRPDGPVSLARAMLAGQRQGEPVQMLLLIGIRR